MQPHTENAWVKVVTANSETALGGLVLSLSSYPNMLSPMSSLMVVQASQKFTSEGSPRQSAN